MFTIAPTKKSPRFCFHFLLVFYVIFVAALILFNTTLIQQGLFFTNSQYQTNVNIQICKSQDKRDWNGFQKVVDSRNKNNEEKKEQNGDKKSGWVKKAYAQNALYDHPVIRRINNLKVFYITAVASNTSTDAYWDKVAINGWEVVWRNMTRDQPKYYCCFETNGRMDLTEVSKKNYWGLRYPGVAAAAQFICETPHSALNEKPNRVALTVTAVCKEKGLKFVNVDYAFMQPDNTIGVCAKIAYGQFPAERILEWMEINKEMGADHVVLFTYNLTDQALNVVNHYAHTGFVTTNEFDFPMKMTYPRRLGQKYTLSWHDEQVAVFDCMERLQGYHYVAVLDLDEFLIPKAKDYYDWKVMLEKLSWLYPYAAGLSFHTQIFTLDWGVSNPDGEFFVSKYINRTRPMWDRRKNIINPQKVVPGSVWTHGFRSLQGFRIYKLYPANIITLQERSWNVHNIIWTFPECSCNVMCWQGPRIGENISSLVADILHYRSCRSQWIEQGTCYENRMRFKDTTMLKITPRVRDRLIALRETLLT